MYWIYVHIVIYYITQPDGTLFFLIFTYLRGRSHWNSRDYASNVAICHFLKPETNKGDFRLYFELVEKSCRGRHHSEISKTKTKTLIYSIWIRPQGSLGCQKMRQDPLNTPFEVWSANIAPKLKNIRNTLRKQGFFDIFFSIFMIFQSLCLFGAILAQKLNSFICRKKNLIFWHPWDPWERVHIDLNKNSVQTGGVIERLWTSKMETKVQFLIEAKPFFT